MDGSGPLFDTIMVIENYPLDNRLVPGGCPLSINSHAMTETTHYNLSVGIVPNVPLDKIEINFSFKQELFDKEFIENLGRHFKNIIQMVIEKPGMVLSQLEIISLEEKNRILYEFNNTAAEYPVDKTIHELFAAQVEQTPDYIALHGCMIAWMDGEVGANRHLRVCSSPNARNVSLTYRQLNKQSDHLAGLLIEKGVLPDTIVGIMMERSIEMIIAIMGILKSGGAYLPIDPNYPQERIDYMLKDSKAKVLIINKSEIRNSKPETNPNNQNKNFGIPFVLNLDHLNFEFVSNFDIRASNLISSNLAYIIYTSGTTGRPKGVLIEHASVVNRLYWVKEQYGLTGKDVILQSAAFVFDVSVCELFRWIPAGARLCLLPPGGQMDPILIIQTIGKFAVTTADFVPSVINLVLDQVEKHQSYHELASLRWMFTGVEIVTSKLVKRFRETLERFNHTGLINAYGPTESTVDVTHFLCKDGYHDVVPIGKPMANVQVYIIDKWGNLQPTGIAGELCIAGSGLARGYLNNPELTRGSFEKPPLDPTKLLFNYLPITNHQSPIYKTGDLARWLPAGVIEFLGRIDHQVKIRGFRV
jgi:amino acid adenylation domain-containing protein